MAGIKRAIAAAKATKKPKDKWPEFEIAFGSRDAGGEVGVQAAVKLTMFGESRTAYFQLDKFLSESGLDIYLKRRDENEKQTK